MPFSFEYIAHARALHDYIQCWKATTLTRNGRKYVGVMNRLRTKLAYSLIKA